MSSDDRERTRNVPLFVLPCQFDPACRIQAIEPFYEDGHVGEIRLQILFSLPEGSFYITESNLLNLLRRGSVSGNPSAHVGAGGIIYLNKTMEDRANGERWSLPTVEISRVGIAEILTKLDIVRDLASKLYENVGGAKDRAVPADSAWRAFPRRADLTLIEEALRARGALTTPGEDDCGFDRDGFMEDMGGPDEPKPEDLPDEPEAKDEPKQPDESGGSDEATEASGEKSTAPETDLAETEEDPETKKKREMAAMWEAEAREHDRELYQAFQKMQAEAGRSGPERRTRR